MGGPREYLLEREQRIPLPIDETFAFFAAARNLEAITPGWLRFRILEAPDELRQGSLLEYRLRLFGWPIRWRTEISRWSPPRSFTDRQIAGPYPLWEHRHTLEEVAGGTIVRDRVRYRVPGGPLAPLVQPVVRIWLDAIFDYRRDALARLLTQSAA